MLLATIIAAALVYAAWQFSSQIASDALLLTHDPKDYPVRVAGSTADSVSLEVTGDDEEADRDLRSTELLGLEWPAGYGHLGPVLGESDGVVTRTYMPLVGEAPAPETMVSVDGFAYPSPSVAGVAAEDVTFPAPLGDLAAWQVPGERPTWAIFTHGRGVDRDEALRILPTVVDAGYPALVITYRNDEGMPRTDDGFVRFGATEWEDLEAAVRYALDHGAEDVILYGYSMGGAITVSFALRSPLASQVRAMVLDAPALDFGAIIDAEAAGTNLPLLPIRVPKFLTSFAKWMTTHRYDVDWGELDYVARAAELRAPVLLFHGADDDRVPVGTSDRLAAARPDLVTYERFDGTGHVRAWNVDRTRYEAAVREFLAGL